MEILLLIFVNLPYSMDPYIFISLIGQTILSIMSNHIKTKKFDNE